MTRLTLPPVTHSSTPQDAESELKEAYRKLDILQDEENTAELLAMYDPDFVVKTDQFTNNLQDLKTSLIQSLFSKYPSPSIHRDGWSSC